MEYLSAKELLALISRVFKPAEDENTLAIIVDMPGDASSDIPRWLERRQIVFDWYKLLRRAYEAGETAIITSLYLYKAVGANNGDLPDTMCRFSGDVLPLTAAELADNKPCPLAEVLGSNRLFLAPTQYSATAPLKLAAPKYGFKAATMPGFSSGMIPALRIDYQEVSRRVLAISNLLTKATGAAITFKVNNIPADIELFIDLRYRQAHSSTGLLQTSGTAGNVPSGESYIVPYEGEKDGISSRTHGTMPVQFGAEMLYYQIENNRAIGVTGCGPKARQECAMLREEPAYGNIAELGLGVLTDFGLTAIGEILLDEKLGLHIAFGRSDHFGGQVGAKDFHDPHKMVHIDRVYVKELQPAVSVRKCVLEFDDGSNFTLIENDQYAANVFKQEPLE